MQHDTLVILDFGSQYAQLIARRLREMGVYGVLLPGDIDVATVARFNPKGLIFSGGPASAHDGTDLKPHPDLYTLGIPVLGICYGMQIMAQQCGGQVQAAETCEFGYANITLSSDAPLLSGIADRHDAQGDAICDVWMSHGDHVVTLPTGFALMASSADCPIAAMADTARHFYGLQFHPEVTHTTQGERMLEAFALGVCQVNPTWTTGNIIEDHVARIRAQVGDAHVLVALSGGVDSSVTAALLHRAIGDQLHCVFVDTGLLRLGEADQVMAMFAEHRHFNLQKIDAKDDFFNALKGLSDPEAKRKCIGALFITLFEQHAKQRGDCRFLGQGTIYPDVIESAKSEHGKAQVIKSHHNVGGLPARMNMALVEPLRDLFKDEVRRLGEALGLPASWIRRHPFPGPGLAIRVMGEVKPAYVTILQQVDHLFIQALHEADLYHSVSQAFAVFLPVKTVGVKGDKRAYDYVVALRAVKTIDFMTAQWADLPYDFLSRLSEKIMNSVPQVARVVYDISGKPPATIEWE